MRPGLLYLGTENALYVSFDDGEHWQPLQSDLPPAPVYWLDVQPHFNDLVVATYGRGFWILDDITPLQQLRPRSEAAGRADALRAAAGLPLPRPRGACLERVPEPGGGHQPRVRGGRSTTTCPRRPKSRGDGGA